MTRRTSAGALILAFLLTLLMLAPMPARAETIVSAYSAGPEEVGLVTIRWGTAADAPTAHGRLSSAVRWHGTRPALLWELEPHEGTDPVTITVPGLDPTWSTTDPRGEALLAELPPPARAEAMTLVAEPAAIAPEMRRPGAEPGPVPPVLPEGGSFS